MPKKQFIDKKKAVTFHLLHRSQQDPLVADETAPQRVLVPIQGKSQNEGKKKVEDEHKYGIYFDDDYNYLQHLRDTSTTVEWVEVEKRPGKVKESNIKLPSSVFASKVEEDVGLLNKAAPQSGLRLDLDPDVVAAMDEDFDYGNPDNELEDNFIELANAEGSDSDEEMNSDDLDSDFNESEERDEVGCLEKMYDFNDVETKSRFTDYSMSSSVIRRNDKLALLDDRFEKFYEGYDENEIGALDCEDIEGFVPENSNILLQYADEFERQRKREQLDKDSELLRIRLQEEESSSSDEDLMKMKVPEKEKWDCESILSTYSNIYNHPKLIEPPQSSLIKIDKRTGIPKDVLGGNKLTAKALSKLNGEDDFSTGPKSTGARSIISTFSTLSVRNKDESPEEKKERKKQLRDYRRERRKEKKLNTMAFKEEKKRQNKILINNQNNPQGNRLM